MRTQPILLLAGGLAMAACNGADLPGPVGPDPDDPPTNGTLMVSTSTVGDDPDLDGYLATIDGADSISLRPSGTSRIDLPSGRHTVHLIGIAEQCSVAPATALEVDLPPQTTTSVAFKISCPLTGVRVTTTTTGLDLDPDGYRIVVDGMERMSLPANGSVSIGLEPGARTVSLTGLAPNCTADNSSSQTATIVVAEVVPIAFTVVCTALTGSPMLAFVSNGDIYVSRIDGSGLQRLTSDDLLAAANGEPTWSPDGKRIAFTRSDSDGGSGIYVMDADGTHLARLSREGVYDASPTWSPDGKRIAFESMRDSTGYGGMNSWLDPEIYVMNADGTHQVRLIKHLGYNDGAPAWSPDGTRIAYVSDTRDGYGIYVANADGTHSGLVTSGTHNDYNPAWSPDSRRIVFSRERDLVAVDADGTNLTLVADGGSELGGLGNPAWSPDGFLIAFTRVSDCIRDPWGDYHCQAAIWTVHLASGQMSKLPLAVRRSGGASWRP